MKALVYRGSGQKEYVEKAMPVITKPTDAIVKIIHTTICGTDLHILKGDVPAVTDGTVLGHEGVGIVTEIGDGVTNFKIGDKVIISCVSACGKCDYCKRGISAHCTDGGWILGHLIDGTQAEYVRIPHADNSLYLIDGDDKDDKALVMLSDILPTGLEIGVLKGNVQPGSTVAIVGAGPIGLSALLTAQFYSPSEIIMIDLDDARLEAAQKFGATHVVNPSNGDAVNRIMELTDGKGVDVAIEAVGIDSTFDICQRIVTAGGNIAVAGVYGKSVNFEIEKLWIKNITLTTGLVSAVTTPMLIKTVDAKKLLPELLITHHFTFDQMLEAYDVFEKAADNKALKVIISAV